MYRNICSICNEKYYLLQKIKGSLLEKIELASIHSKEMSLLIGANVLEVFIQLEVKKSNPGQPKAVWIPLGWKLFGRNNKTKRCEMYSVHLVHQNDHDSTTQIIKEFWEKEEG